MLFNKTEEKKVMLKKFYLIGIAILVISVGMTTNGIADEIIFYDDFDDGVDNWDGWVNTGAGAVVDFFWDEDFVLAGEFSYRIEVTTGSETNYYIQRNTRVPLTPGKGYILSYIMVATSDTAESRVTLEDWGSPYRNYLQVTPIYVTTTPRVYYDTLLALAEPILDANGETGIKFNYGGDVNDNTIFWLDSVVLRELHGIADLPDTNLITNAEFDDLTDWTTSIDASATAAIDIDPDSVLSCQNSLNVSITDGGATADLITASTPLPIEVSYDYEISFWAVADSPGTDIVVVVAGASEFSRDTITVDTSITFANIEIDSTTAADANANLEIHFGGADNDNVNIWIDAVNAVRESALPTAIFGGPDNIANQYALYQNYPNPFNPTTTIKFNVPVSGNVSIVLVNILGQVVQEITNDNYAAGPHAVEFNASKLSSGIYFYKMEAGDFVRVKKLMLLK